MPFHTLTLDDLLKQAPKTKNVKALTAKKEAQYRYICAWAEGEDTAASAGTWIPKRAGSSGIGLPVAAPKPRDPIAPTPAPQWGEMVKPLQREVDCEDPIPPKPRGKSDLTAKEIVADYLRFKEIPVSSPLTDGPSPYDRRATILAGLDTDKWLSGRHVDGFFGPDLDKGWTR